VATDHLRKVDFPETSYILYLNYVSSQVYILRINVIYLETVNILFVFFSSYAIVSSILSVSSSFFYE